MVDTKDRTKPDTRHRILESARHFLTSARRTDWVLDDVAKHASVAKGTLYLYFKSKEDLIHAVFEHINDGVQQEIALRQSGWKTPMEALKGRMQIYLACTDQNQDFFLVQVCPAVMNAGKQDCSILQPMEDIKALIRQAGAQGLLPKVDPAFGAVIYFSTIRAMMIDKFLSKRTWKLDTQTDRAFHVFAKGLEGGVD